MTALTAIICSVIVLLNVTAHPGFRDAIPNGYNVPNPCPGTFDFWEGVGHNIREGGGPPNLFGVDFIAHNSTWTRELCSKDSDGDGFPNGLELGDPDCIWMQGSSAQPRFKAMGHPGVCTPMFTPACDPYNINITCY